MSRTKLVCTIGPASRDRVAELIAAGMSVARLNFSHATVEEHAIVADRVRRHASEQERTVALLADLPGPKVRLGELPHGELELQLGAELLLNGSDGLATNYPGLADDLRPGDSVLLADGAAELRVVGTKGTTVRTEVTRAGLIRSRAGVNVPSERLGLPALTQRDRSALGAALQLDVDYVAQSFVRRADDVRELRRALGDRGPRLMVKLETRAAIDDLDGILAEADALMLARGDLGVELPYSDVPIIQKQVLRAAAAAGVPVVVATQMLESMTDAPRPTRAEANDVANAVLDGADAVMLSAETAIGAFPVLAAQAAVAICEAVEQQGGAFGTGRPSLAVADEAASAAAIAAAAVELAGRELTPPIVAITCFTRTGLTAELLSALRPPLPIHALSPDAGVLRRLALWHGVVPVLSPQPSDTDAMIEMMQRAVRAAAAEPGDHVVMVGSIPFGEARTNFVKLHRLTA